MNEKLTGTLFGSTIGMIGGLTTDKVIEVIVLSLLGGIMGAMGATLWKWIRKKWNNGNR